MNNQEINLVVRKTLQDLIPAQLFDVLLDKVSLIENCSRGRLGQSDVEKVVRFIINNHIDYIFITEKHFLNQVNIALRLKQLEKRSLFIILNEPTDMQMLNGFPSFHLKLSEISNLLSKTSVTVFSQGWLFGEHLPFLIEAMKGKNQHFIDFMDLNSLVFYSLNKEIEDLLKVTWGPDAVVNNQMQVWCEKFLFKNADRCYFPGGFRHIESLGLNNKHIGRKFFVNYKINKDDFCSNTATKDFVLAGTVTSNEARRIPQFFDDSRLISTVEPLLKNAQNLSVEVLNNPEYVELKSYRQIYKEHYDLMKKYPNYKFIRGFTGKRLRQYIASFKCGLMYLNLTNIVFSKIHAKCIVATRFYLYLEAGIPVLVSADHVELGDLVAKYQIGVVADWDENFDLNEVVQNYDLNAMRRNVISARKDIFDIGLHQLL